MQFHDSEAETPGFSGEWEECIYRISKDATNAVQYCSICRTKLQEVWFINNWLNIQSSMKSNKNSS